MLTKFLEYQRSITILSIKYLNFNFLYSNIMHKIEVYRLNSK